MDTLNRMTVADQFGDAIRSAGLTSPDAIDADGRLHRFASNGKREDDSGWYVLHGDGIPAGAFGDWRTGLTQSWRADLGRPLTAEEESQHRSRLEAIRAQRAAEEGARSHHAKAEAERIWTSAVPAQEHEYLRRKGIKPCGVRLHNGWLVLPLYDNTGTLHSLQFINPQGEKRFLPKGRVKGGYFTIGEPQGVLYLVEGFATGASIHEATGEAVIVAFNAGNLKPVAMALRERFPDARLVLCADDDAATPGNPGLTKATEAAQAVNGLLAVPDFGDNRPEGATDFNDLHRTLGVEAVKQSIGHARKLDEATGKSEPSDWLAPKPILAALHPVPPFDADTLLPEALRGWVMDEADRMPCPPDFIAVAALVALGAIIGARCAIKPKARDSWLIVPNLWGGIVGLRAPLRREKPQCRPQCCKKALKQIAILSNAWGYWWPFRTKANFGHLPSGISR